MNIATGMVAGAFTAVMFYALMMWLGIVPGLIAGFVLLCWAFVVVATNGQGDPAQQFRSTRTEDT